MSVNHKEYILRARSITEEFSLKYKALNVLSHLIADKKLIVE